MITSHHAATIMPISSGTHLAQAAALYREVFGYTNPVDGISPRLLRGLIDNGGLVIGALDVNQEVVGFAYGFHGSDSAGCYHYSQAAVVSPQFQGHQLGRRLKIEQAVRAAAQGHDRMRWAYDPALVRNAHFNLNVLGAYGIYFSPDYYDDENSDRVIVQWNLNADGPVPYVVPSKTPTQRLEVEVSRHIPELRTQNSPQASGLTRQLGQQLATCFSEGLVLSSCELSTPDSATYVFTRPAGGSSVQTAGRRTL